MSSIYQLNEGQKNTEKSSCRKTTTTKLVAGQRPLTRKTLIPQRSLKTLASKSCMILNNINEQDENKAGIYDTGANPVSLNNKKNATSIQPSYGASPASTIKQGAAVTISQPVPRTELESAMSKLEALYPPFSSEYLPNNKYDPMWVDIQSAYGLTHSELCCLKNASCPIVGKGRFGNTQRYLFELRNNTGVPLVVKVNGMELEDIGSLVYTLARSAACNLAEIKRHVLRRLSSGRPVDPLCKLQFSAQELHQQGWVEYQKSFNNANESSPYILCTSSGETANGAAPIAKAHNGVAFTFTGRCDNLSTVRPMAIEFRGAPHTITQPASTQSLSMNDTDWSVLEAAIERAMSMSNLHSHIATFFVFAVTGQKAWLVWVKREWSRSSEVAVDTLVETLHIMRAMDTNLLQELWPLLTQQALDYRDIMYVNRTEAILLTRAVKQWCPAESFCRYVAIGASKSRVFGITFPQMHSVVRGKVVVGVAKDVQHIAIKVVRDTDEFDREVSCLRKIWTEINRRQATATATEAGEQEFYAIGYLDGRDWGSCPMHFGMKQWGAFAEQVREVTRAIVPDRQERSNEFVPWWLYSPDDGREVDGGVIIMRCGLYKESGEQHQRAELQSLAKDACFWLRLSHKAGVLHRDVRGDNLIKIGALSFDFTREFKAVPSPSSDSIVARHPWQLIDFGGSWTEADADVSGGELTGTSGDGLLSHGFPGLEERVMQIDKRYARYKHAGYAVLEEGGRHLASSFMYKWTYADDYEMLLRMLENIRDSV